MSNLIDIIGLKIVAAKGFPKSDKRLKTIELQYLLLDDKETYITFEEQDPYTYHGFYSSARLISVRKNAEEWKIIMDTHPDANDDFTV